MNFNIWKQLLNETKYESYEDYLKDHPNHKSSGRKYPPAKACTASWVSKNILARSCRPGYPKSKDINEDTAEKWLECVINNLGVKPKTIITFLHSEELYGKNYELGFYNFNLIDWYKKQGIDVKWIPTKDPVHGGNKETFSEDKLKKIVELINELPKPVLIHCSAGIDRTGAVAYYYTHGKMKPKFQSFSDYKNSPQDKFKNRYGNWRDNNPMIQYGD